MSPQPERTAGDKYRIEVSAGSLFRDLFRLGAARTRAAGPEGARAGQRPASRGGLVRIVDEAGNTVWERPVESRAERDALIDLIQKQVFTARLEDFEHWLRTEGQIAFRR